VSERQHVLWGLAAAAVAAVWTISGCTSSDATAPPPAEEPDAGSGDDDNGLDPNSYYQGSATVPTDANLKVAFTGDTDTGDDFKKVLALVKSEGAQLLVVQGDLTYSYHPAADWFAAADGLGIPYFASKGNHDYSWTQAGGLGAGFDDRLGKWSITPDDGKPSAQSYSVTYKGLKFVMVGDTGGTSDSKRPTYVAKQLQNDDHIWKICSWHKNQRATNVGPKEDEMGWTIYEYCRQAGAIVAQGHSHTYARSKTITADQAQTVDDACGDPFDLCIAPGKHFFFDASLGGVETRAKDATWGAKPWWGATYDADFGALFIEFNVDGDPKKAHGYFKNVGGTIVDPPASTGKSFFTITAQ